MVLLVFNSLIISAMHKRGKNFQGKDSQASRYRTETSRSQKSVTNTEGIASRKKPSRKTVRSEMSLTIMLLLVTFTFLFLTTPVYVYYLYYMDGSYLENPNAYATFVFYGYVTTKLYQTNYSINFFLYALGGSKFRNQLKTLLKRWFTVG